MKTTPFRHQAEGYEVSKDLEYFAVWWEQGTGKSKLLVDTACHLYTEGKIEALLIIAPNGVHGNFITQEMPVHAWVNWTGFVYNSDRAGTKKAKYEVERMLDPSDKRLKVVAISYDAVARTKAGFEFASAFLQQFKAMGACDESTAIAEPTTQRAKKVALLGPLCRYRRVMSGTPVAEGPFKIFNQMRWLDPNYWKKYGLTSYYAFRQTFGIYKKKTAAAGHQFEQLVEYRCLPYLQQLVAEHSSRVLKEDVLDLPPKVYTKVEFELTPKQRQIYDDIVEKLAAEIDETHMLEAATALVRLTRLQQITSGVVVVNEMPPPAIGDLVVLRCNGYDVHGEITELSASGAGYVVGLNAMTGQDNWQESFVLPDARMVRLVAANQKTIELFENPMDNPRLRALDAVLEPITHKVIIWARYRYDVDNICKMLGESAVRYDGIVGTRDREIALDRFRHDPTIRYFVANPQTLSMGVTLTQAKTVIYYSNTFQLEKRLQSEDRAHRIGQDTSVNIIDLAAADTVDGHIIQSLRKKFNLAAIVTGDKLREWLT